MYFQPQAVNSSPLCLAAAALQRWGGTAAPGRAMGRGGGSGDPEGRREFLGIPSRSLGFGEQDFSFIGPSAYTAENGPIARALSLSQVIKVAVKVLCTHEPPYWWWWCYFLRTVRVPISMLPQLSYQHLPCLPNCNPSHCHLSPQLLSVLLTGLQLAALPSPACHPFSSPREL